MLLGTFTPKLDDKGRLIIPAKFRKEFSEGVVLTRGQERCLYIFSEEEFAKVHQSIKQAPLTSKHGRDFTRMFLSGAHDEKPDKQNRINIPNNLRNYANLDKDLAFIGTGNRAEIWDLATWNAYLAEQEEIFSSIEEEVIPGLF